MTKNQREFFDRDHPVMDAYYDLCERFDGRRTKSMKKQLKGMIEKDPDFLDPYLMLYDILRSEGDIVGAKKELDTAYERALNLITDEEGRWPDVLLWAWLENRHIIRTILNKAISLWIDGDVGGALDLFRRLLRSNPNDNVGARDYILAIRLNMSFEDFEGRFNKGGYYDMELAEWFEENYKKFPDEFGWWEEEVQ